MRCSKKGNHVRNHTRLENWRVSQRRKQGATCQCAGVVHILSRRHNGGVAFKALYAVLAGHARRSSSRVKDRGTLCTHTLSPSLFLSPRSTTRSSMSQFRSPGHRTHTQEWSTTLLTIQLFIDIADECPLFFENMLNETLFAMMSICNAKNLLTEARHVRVCVCMLMCMW